MSAPHASVFQRSLIIWGGGLHARLPVPRPAWPAAGNDNGRPFTD